MWLLGQYLTRSFRVIVLKNRILYGFKTLKIEIGWFKKNTLKSKGFMKSLFWKILINAKQRVLIPCEISMKSTIKHIILFLLDIPKLGKFWDVTDYHP
jgi:hypothetical protein